MKRVRKGLGKGIEGMVGEDKGVEDREGKGLDGREGYG